MRQPAYTLPIKSDHEFPVAGRDLHVTGPSLVEEGIRREKRGMSGFITERYLTLRWDPQCVNETGRCISIKPESQRWPFSRPEKTPPAQVVPRVFC